MSKRLPALFRRRRRRRAQAAQCKQPNSRAVCLAPSYNLPPDINALAHYISCKLNLIFMHNMKEVVCYSLAKSYTKFGAYLPRNKTYKTGIIATRAEELFCF